MSTSEYKDNPYEELGVETTADTATIKKAYRKLALVHHPDRNGGDTAKFAKIANAYEILTDDHLRAEYDRSCESSCHDDDDDSSSSNEGDNVPEATANDAASSTKSKNTTKLKKKKKKKKKKTKKRSSPPIFRYHFSDPYEVWKRDFKDMYGFEYPGAKYDWVSHDDQKACDFIDRHNQKTQQQQKSLENDDSNSRSAASTTKQQTKEPVAKPKRRGFASLFRRKNNKNNNETDAEASTALVPVAANNTSALVPSNEDALTSTTNEPDNSQALVATTGRNNRPISMDVKTVQDGPVTITTTTLVRPDGSTETITTRSGLPGPPPQKHLALTNGSEDKSTNQKLLTDGGNDTKALPESTTIKKDKKKKKEKKEKKASKKALTDGTKPKSKAVAIENGSQALVPMT